MIIEQPPFFYRFFFPKAYWKMPKPGQKTVYLTFDDGPIPEATPWILDVLDKYGIKATFFCVGDNVRKYASIYEDVLQRGHRVGNHTHNHLQGWKTWTATFLKNAQAADSYIRSRLFRPPHGHMRYPQAMMLKAKGYKIVMWDVVTRDYSWRVDAEQIVENIKKYTRDGSIIVFHDSLKSIEKLYTALPQSLDWLIAEGYKFELIPE